MPELTVSFKMTMPGYQNYSWTQTFEFSDAWNPQAIEGQMQARWLELRAEFMEMFVGEPGGAESEWQRTLVAWRETHPSKED